MSQPIDEFNDLKQLPRQAQLKAWLAMHGIKHRELAIKLGVHPSMVSRIICGERAPGKRIRELMALGIPESLLPSPNRRSPGRPRAVPEGTVERDQMES
jgi:transcriptional regulator with XRE-family HTH domain